MDGMRLRLKPKARKDRIKEALGGIYDKRFMPLQKKLIWDLGQGNFKSLDLGLYLRLGGWSHTSGTYAVTMVEVEALCEALFGYRIPEKIGKVYLKVYRYRSGKGLEDIAPIIAEYHERHMKQGE